MRVSSLVASLTFCFVAMALAMGIPPAGADDDPHVNGITWHRDLAEATAEAAQTKRPLCVVFR